MSATISAQFRMSKVSGSMQIKLSDCESVHIHERGTFFDNVEFVFPADQISGNYSFRDVGDGRAPVEFNGPIVVYADVWVRNDILITTLLNGSASVDVDFSHATIKVNDIDSDESDSKVAALQARLIKGLFSPASLEASMYITHG